MMQKESNLKPNFDNLSKTINTLGIELGNVIKQQAGTKNFKKGNAADTRKGGREHDGEEELDHGKKARHVTAGAKAREGERERG